MSAVSNNKSLLLKWAITIIVPILIFFIPLSETYTAPMRSFFVITLLCILIMAFELMNTMAISILMPMLYLIFIAPAETVFSAWISTTAWTCVGAMLLANILASSGLLNRISYWVISKCGSFTATVFGVLIVGVIISFLTGVMGSLLVYTFAYGIARGLNIVRTKESAVLMFAAIFSTTTVEMFIYKPVFMSLINGQIALYLPGEAIEYLELLIANWPFFLMIVLIIWLYLKIYKIKSEGNVKEEFKQKLNALGSMTLYEKKAAGLGIIVVGYMISSSFTGLPMDYGLMFIPWLSYLPIINLGTTKDIREINWEPILFVAACMGIGGVGAYAGVTTLVSSFFMDTIAPLGGFVAMGAIYVFGILLNFLMTPMAMLASFLGPVIEIGQEMGMNPDGLIYIFYSACDQIILPYEYANYLLGFSFGLMTMKQFISMSLIKLIIGTIFIFTVMVAWWNLIGVL